MVKSTPGAHLLNVWDMLIQVIEAHGHGEEGKSNKEEPGGFAEPGAVQCRVGSQENGPAREPRLVQFKEVLIILQRQVGRGSAPCRSTEVVAEKQKLIAVSRGTEIGPQCFA